jgi:short-subunit dehydrogenase
MPAAKLNTCACHTPNHDLRNPHHGDGHRRFQRHRLELGKCCARNGFDLLIAADDPAVEQAASTLRELGAAVDAVQADRSTTEGVDKLYAAIGGRPVEALLANAGRGLGNAFLDQDFAAARKVVDTSITGTIYLIQKVGRDMRDRKRGRILITGSIAGFMPGAYQAVYDATKSFLDPLSFALRHEVAGDGVTVTCLMLGATETDFFERTDLMDTKVGTAKKDDAGMVAEKGFRAMMNGEGDVVTGWHNKLMTAIASVTPPACWPGYTRDWRSPERQSNDHAS